jgi:hypothetical protein
MDIHTYTPIYTHIFIIINIYICTSKTGHAEQDRICISTHEREGARAKKGAQKYECEKLEARERESAKEKARNLKYKKEHNKTSARRFRPKSKDKKAHA